MAMTRKVSFKKLQDARLEARLTLEKTLELLEISERSYYRWKANDAVPHWAVRMLEMLSGDLERYGWKNWRIEHGELQARDGHDGGSRHGHDRRGRGRATGQPGDRRRQGERRREVAVDVHE